jgi:hypothetical protein
LAERASRWAAGRLYDGRSLVESGDGEIAAQSHGQEMMVMVLAAVMTIDLKLQALFALTNY